ncbi:MAG: hypothetical protein IID31_13850 [Planctomycetes bacterium]|nr:hypothetical protein [Planctomycetota bacterium]
MAKFEFNDSPEQQAIRSAMRLAAAKHPLGKLECEDAIKLADAALDAGIYTDAVRELALDSDCSSYPDEAILRVFTELNIPILDEDKATLFLIYHYMRRIADGGDQPIDLLGELDYFIDNCFRRFDYANERLFGDPTVDQLFIRIFELDCAQLDLYISGEAAFKYRGQRKSNAVGWLEQDIIRLAKDWGASDECCK